MQQAFLSVLDHHPIRQTSVRPLSRKLTLLRSWHLKCYCARFVDAIQKKQSIFAGGFHMSNELRWLGHAAWQLTTSKGKVFLIDPWLSENPVAAIGIDELPKAEYLLLTHDHGDHASDTPAVVKQTGAMLVAQPEITERYRAAGVPEENTLYGTGMNIGGSVTLDGVKVTMTDAYHTSETGEPAGFILTLEDGKVVYFAGDTGIHANMVTWGELYAIDVAVLPIGGHFTMDGEHAAHALRMLRAKVALPTHYKTFPLLAQDADAFVEHAQQQAPDATVHVMDIGDTYCF